MKTTDPQRKYFTLPTDKEIIEEGQIEELDYIFSSDRKSILKCKSNERNIVIPEGIIRIGGGAFAYNQHMVNIYLPKSLKIIDKYAFFHCERLVNVYFSNHTKLDSIGDSAFSCCFRIPFMRLPRNVDFIGRFVFLGCDFHAIELPREIGTLEEINSIFNNHLHTIKLPQKCIDQLQLNSEKDIRIICYNRVDKATGLTENALETYKDLEKRYKNKIYCEPFLANPLYDLNLSVYYIDHNEQLENKYIVRGTTEENPNKRFISSSVIVAKYDSLKELVQDGWRCDFCEIYETTLLPM